LGPANLPKANQVRVISLQRSGEYQPLLRGSGDSFGMRSGLVMLEPAKLCGQHSTKAHEELLVVLQGSGCVLVGDEAKPVSIAADQVVYIPPHTVHNVKNTGSDPLHYIYIVAPVSHSR